MAPYVRTRWTVLALRHPIDSDPATPETSFSDPRWRLDPGQRIDPKRRPRRRLRRVTLLLALPTAIAVSWHAGIDPVDLLRSGYAMSMRAVDLMSRQEPKKIASERLPSPIAPQDEAPPRKEGEETLAPKPPHNTDTPRDPRRPEDVAALKPTPIAPAEPAKRPAAPEKPPAPENDPDEEPASSTPIPPPPAALTPAQRRAEAAGLHTGLSRVLLERLTAADYRNATEAIRRALAAPRDDGPYVWPPRTEGSSAQFTVRFVAGAAQGCRRYVVTILKDRWETTALPVERCVQSRSASQRP